MGKKGFIAIGRGIIDSDIWVKPAWWLRVWLYLIASVNHSDYKNLKRGEGVFTSSKIHNDCFLAKEGVSARTVENVIKWLKQTEQITARKTTRGMVIRVLNYNKYQNLSSYKDGTEDGTEDEKIAELSRKNSGMINNHKTIKPLNQFSNFSNLKKTQGQKKLPKKPFSKKSEPEKNPVLEMSIEEKSAMVQEWKNNVTNERFQIFDEGYAEKTLEQGRKLSPVDKNEFLRKIFVANGFFKNRAIHPATQEHYHKKAQVVCNEVAGLVNDKGDCKPDFS